MSGYQKTIWLTVFAVLVVSCRLMACPFCLAPPQTFSEQFLLADVVVIAELLKFEVLSEGTQPKSTLRIREILSDEGDIARRCGLSPGMSVVIFSEAAGKAGDLFLMYGDLRDPQKSQLLQTFVGVESDSNGAAQITGGAESALSSAGAIRAGAFRGDRVIRKTSLRVPDRVDWTEHLAISAVAADYLRRMPPRAEPQSERLAWYSAYLECPDAEVAGDAWAEFGGSSYADVKANRHLYQPELLRQWIADPLMSPERLGLYGLMLGLSGGVEDAEFLVTHMQDVKTGEFRFGAEGLLAGFLLLRGESGLDLVESQFLSSRGTDTSRHALAMTLDFFVSYEASVFSKDRACQTMRQLVGSAVLRQAAISSLSRWEDWAYLPELIRVFDTEIEQGQVAAGHVLDESGLRAILEFARLCEKAGRDSKGPVSAAVTESSANAAEFLKRVEVANPRLLKPAEYEFTAPQ